MNNVSPRARTPRSGILSLLAILLLTGASPKVEPPKLEKGELNPAVFHNLLQSYVTEAGVDYAAWKAEGIEALDEFLKAVGEHDLRSTLGKEPRVAFLINAYNARAIRQILEHYPVDDVREIAGFFDENPTLIAGKARTLDDIEDLLASTASYLPHFPFALNPGARGMPALSPHAYTSENLARRLALTAHGYFVEGKQIRVDLEKNLLFLPPQFVKHGGLIEAQPQGLVGFLAEFLKLAEIVAISSLKPEHVIQEIDWSLNDTPRDGAKP